MLDRLRADEFDVLVIGGGITGAGCALDAASRGLRTALVERDDFASGTSSKSSKLIHGGLRYLQQREVGLVYEALAERQVLREIAPHLVRTLPFLLPVFKGRDGLFDRRIARLVGLSMWMYDFTGGVRIGKLHKKLDITAAQHHVPTLRADRIAYAYLYYDARADDARLTLTIARTAAAHGANVVNRAAVTGFLKDDTGKVVGTTVVAGGEPIEVRAAQVVNATGVWADEVRALDEGAHPQSIRPAKGVHVTVPWAKVRNDIAAVVPVPKDRRSVFVVPWGEFTYVGTTDTDYDGPIDDPQCTAGDVRYLLSAINYSTDARLTEADVLGTWAGLRPLVKDASSARTADLSRQASVRRSASGVVTVTGGKLTTYRRMAADTIDEVVEALGRGGRSHTKRVRLLGADGHHGSLNGASRNGASPNGDSPNGHRAANDHLGDRYGSLAAEVRALVAADPTLGARLVPGLPYLRAEAVYAARHEMATTIDDVLSRRTRARLLARDAAAAAAGDVGALLAAELGWTDAERNAQIAAYRAACDAERAAADLPATALDAALGT
jgi:glycerol-3-phosphate dehydrogenase